MKTQYNSVNPMKTWYTSLEPSKTHNDNSWKHSKTQ